MSSIFLDFHLPDAPTWFYFSLFLAVALFYQFARPLALRNWDLVALFLFAPGFLLLLQANQLAAADQAARSVAGAAASDRTERVRFFGYVWLLAVSAYWFVRCLLDLATVKRPLATPNLSTPGLVWFGASLLVCLSAVAFTRTGDPWDPVGKRPAAITRMEEGAAAVVSRARNGNGEATPDVRFFVERSFAMGCHLAVVAALVLIGVRRFHDLPTGVAAGTLYLLVPYTAYHIGQVHHVWPAALILWAIYLYRHPIAAGLLVGAAAGTVFFPLLLIPGWVHFYRGRGAARFLAGAAIAGAIGLTTTGVVLIAGGELPGGVWRNASLTGWLPWGDSTSESIWHGVHGAYRLPVFIAYLVFVLTTFVWPPVRNLGHLIALSAAVLIGIQFWFADQGGLYVLWYAPLLVLVVLRPNLTELQPVPPGPLPAYVGRAGRWLRNRVRPPRPPSARLPAGL